MNNLVYDYIVIGAGPAGATIAKTLSDDKKNSVLLLEAGENNDEDEPIRSSTFAPVLANLFFHNTFGKEKAYLKKMLVIEPSVGLEVDSWEGVLK